MSEEENLIPTPSETPQSAGPSSVLRWLGILTRLILSAALLTAGGFGAKYMMDNRPAATRRKPVKQPTIVQVTKVKPTTEHLIIPAMGTVMPAKTIQMTTQVSGRIIQVDPEFIPGGHFHSGDSILQIEPKDYELAIEQRKSDLARAQSDLKMEMGQQSVAQGEYEILGQEVQEEDRELLLRGPQLAMKKAVVQATSASLERAQLDLKRTQITAPFNAVIQSTKVDLGSYVNMGTTLASLVWTDEYWVRVLVPMDQIQWIDIPKETGQEGSIVRVRFESAWGPDIYRIGRVKRLMTELEPLGRMARLLVAIEDPLELHASAPACGSLPLGSFVRVDILGCDLPDIVRVPRTALRDGNKVWIATPDGTLDIREVTIAWTGNNHVCVSEGLNLGELLITSDLAAPVAGMEVQRPGVKTENAHTPSPRLESGPGKQRGKRPDAPGPAKGPGEKPKGSRLEKGRP